MTNRELIDLHDDMFYGHEAELSIDGRVIYFEQCKQCIEIYEIVGSKGILLMTIRGSDRNDLINKTFEFPLFDGGNIYSCYDRIEIIAVD